MGRLVEAFPTAVVLENGVIKEKWVEVMPRNFIQRIKPNLVVSRLCEVWEHNLSKKINIG